MTVIAVGLIAYSVTSVALFIFGANMARMSLVAWRHRHRRPEPPAPPVDGAWPTVTVQLPIYNEAYVARRVIEAAAALDYPTDRLEIQVLDDSTDETVSIVDAVASEVRRAGVDIVVLRRDERRGYKAGALATGLAAARGELIAVFDADFVPPADFLRRAVPHLLPGPGDDVGFVQGRWGHINADHSWLTRLQAAAIDAHFLVEQASRGARGHWFNFNGTAGVWRAEAIVDSGGWHHDTLTEDLDLSYRAHLRGWRGVYLPDLVVPAELPVEVTGFRRQQRRWARGSVECARKLLGPLWRSPAALGVKVQATLHLLAYTVHLLLLLLILTYPFVALAAWEVGVPPWLAILGTVLAPASVAPLAFLLVGQAVQGPLGWRRVLTVLGLIVFGAGLMLNTAQAVLGIVTRPTPVFRRTPKFGLGPGDPTERWATNRYRLGGDPIALAELAVGGYALATAALAAQLGVWGIAVFSFLFGAGLVAVAVTSAIQAITVGARRSDRPSTPPPTRPVDPATAGSRR